MIKSFNDYVDSVHARWNTMDKEQIRKIILHGFGRLFQSVTGLNSVRIDTPLGNVKFLSMSSSNKNWINFFYKQTVRRLRWEYSMLKTNDPYYYIGFTKEDWKKYSKQIKNREPLTFKHVIMYKVESECLTHRYFHHYIKVYYPFNQGYRIEKENFKTLRYKYIGKRDAKGRVKLL